MSGFFSQDELKKISTNFWNDGAERHVTIEKEWRQGKTDPTKEVLWIKAYDVSEKKEVSFCDFNFLAALKKLPDGKYDNAILKVVPRKTGEREYNGKQFDVLEYDITATGEFAEQRVAVGDVGF